MHFLRSAALALAICTPLAAAQSGPPPSYASFGRTQSGSHTPDPDRVLRIWLIYVDQGDGLLIQLPRTNDYDPDPGDPDPTRSERVDVLIDGGSNPVSEGWRAADFVEVLYGPEAVIEHAVISHHDQDHVEGLRYLLRETDISVRDIFHNGLASYRPGFRGFVLDQRPASAIYKWRSGRLQRGMARITQGGTLDERDVVDSLPTLRTRLAANEFQGVYHALARSIVHGRNPGQVRSFRRARTGTDFINEVAAAGGSALDVRFDVLWPRDRMSPYPEASGNWSETVNGNSVTFMLTYGDFRMLFTGDHNEHSEASFLSAVPASELRCDVLKVPHHGSSHGSETFFRTCDPVVAVASMGEHGFKSKRVYGRGAWQHPSTDVIRWVGGSHRFYSTLIHEKRFRWPELDTRAKHRAMYEYSHVLIETDGRFFRIVEVPDADIDQIRDPRPVDEVARGDGTLWIRA